MADLEQEIGSWKRTAKDLVSGAAGGIAQVLLGQPFGELPTHGLYRSRQLLFGADLREFAPNRSCLVLCRSGLTFRCQISSKSAFRPPVNTNQHLTVVAKY